MFRTENELLFCEIIEYCVFNIDIEMNNQIINVLSWLVINEYYILNALSVQSNLAMLKLACTQSESSRIRQARILVQPVISNQLYLGWTWTKP